MSDGAIAIAGKAKKRESIQPDDDPVIFVSRSHATVPRTVLDVFLSSTARDLETHREAIYSRLKRIEFFHCIRQEDFGALNADAIEYCCDKARTADLFVGLIGLRRGWEPKGDHGKRSITELEHDHARDAGRRRYLWVSPDDFPVPGNLTEKPTEHKRQLAFRKKVMGSGERIVSQKGFDSPGLLASEIVEQLLAHVVTGDLITLLRPEFTRQGGESIEERRPTVAAAVEQLAEDKEVDLLKLAENPAGVDVGDLESKLRARATAHETKARHEARISAQYWRHIGALAFLQNTQQALDAYQKAVALDPDETDSWRHLGEVQYRLGDLAAAEKSFDTLSRLGKDSGDARVESIGLMGLGWINNTRGSLATAQDLMESALRLASKAQWKEGIARAYNNLGVVHRTRGDLDSAEEVQHKSLELGKELGSKEGMAVGYSNLGIIHQTRGDLDKAEEMHRMALALDEGLGSKEGMAESYANLGIIHQARGNFEQAEAMQIKALRLNEEVGRKEGMAFAYRDLALIYERAGRKDRLCECLRKARDIWREMGVESELAQVERAMTQNNCGA